MKYHAVFYCAGKPEVGIGLLPGEPKRIDKGREIWYVKERFYCFLTGQKVRTFIETGTILEYVRYKIWNFSVAFVSN